MEVWSDVHPEGQVVYVRDNGVGFDPAFAPHVFERESLVGEAQGHGLRLAAVRALVERHGGRVWAEGRPGRGATVMFSLPRERGGWGVRMGRPATHPAAVCLSGRISAPESESESD